MNLIKTLSVAAGTFLAASTAQAAFLEYEYTGSITGGVFGPFGSEFHVGEAVTLNMVIDTDIADSDPSLSTGFYDDALLSIDVTIGGYQASGTDGNGYATTLSDPFPNDPRPSYGYVASQNVTGPDVISWSLSSLGIKSTEPGGRPDIPFGFGFDVNPLEGFLTFENGGSLNDILFTFDNFTLTQRFDLEPQVTIFAAGTTTTFNAGEVTISNNALLINNGTLNAGGDFTLSIEDDFENNGEFRLDQDASLNNAGTTENTGTINNNATINNTGELENAGVINNAGLFLNDNTTFTFADGGVFNNGGTIVNASNGRLESTQSGPTIIGGTVVNQGVIDGGSNSIIFTGDVSGAGDYEGTVQFDGSFGPGNSPALVTAETLVFGASNTLFMEIGGLGRGSEYDAIDALSVTLGGILDIALIDLANGFSPMAGDTFDLIVADQIMGAFVGFNFATLLDGLFFSTNLITNQFGDDIFQLVVNAAPVQNGVPGPGAMLLLLAGLAGLGAVRKKVV